MLMLPFSGRATGRLWAHTSTKDPFYLLAPVLVGGKMERPIDPLGHECLVLRLHAEGGVAPEWVPDGMPDSRGAGHAPRAA